MTHNKEAAMEAYNNAFYYKVPHKVEGYYVVDNKDRNLPDRRHFWQTCEQIEALEDACEQIKTKQQEVYKGMITELVNGLNQIVGRDWGTKIDNNDDIMWGVIALVRAYELTGKTNKDFLDQAQIQFNKVWKRGFDEELGGGLWFKDSTKTKNACVNFPAIIAAMYLARYTQNTGFRSQAKQLWRWSRESLYNEKTGQVIDHKASGGKLDTQPYTYNQGTFIGAAYMLYLDTGNKDRDLASRYLDDCKLASTFTMKRLTTKSNGVDVLDNNEVNGGDGPGFKGIFARWCSKYATGVNNVSIKEWLIANANMAWKNRNSATSLMSTKWQDPTLKKELTSWECSSGLSIVLNAL